jgi:hypothetical protein
MNNSCLFCLFAIMMSPVRLVSPNLCERLCHKDSAIILNENAWHMRSRCSARPRTAFQEPFKAAVSLMLSFRAISLLSESLSRVILTSSPPLEKIWHPKSMTTGLPDLSPSIPVHTDPFGRSMSLMFLLPGEIGLVTICQGKITVIPKINNSLSLKRLDLFPRVENLCVL